MRSDCKVIVVPPQPCRAGACGPRKAAERMGFGLERSLGGFNCSLKLKGVGGVEVKMELVSYWRCTLEGQEATARSCNKRNMDGA